ncbi:10987_t:CDS:2 [Funneliformis caledonium]|uniref:10987_t:CDS:1 n=1 Tax=Funneliformis caledonium TaxID=1117310 RepID=A0A9N9HSP8_9GLOM|nr:10987_t:CDS:2 [Funneliformis caledonium]
MSCPCGENCACGMSCSCACGGSPVNNNTNTEPCGNGTCTCGEGCACSTSDCICGN